MTTASSRKFLAVLGSRPRRVAVLLAAGLALVLGVWGAERWAEASARSDTDAQARQLAAANASLFGSELQKFRLLPTVLAEYPYVVALLRGRGGTAIVNRQLESLAERTGAAAIYVIRPDGLTLAASNHRLRTSFVGQNYAFRPYFAQALRRGSSELFALGTVSGRPGLFIASRVGDAGRPLGVIVAKIEFDRLERAWAAQGAITFVADRHGVVIVSARPGWRFHRLRSLRPAEVREIAQTRQFAVPLLPLALTLRAHDAQFGGIPYRHADVRLPLAGTQLTALVPRRPALEGARARARLVVLGIAAVIAGIALWLIRQSERLALQRAAQRELEAKVLERTAELRGANEQLVREGAKRQRTEERYRRSREELAQANRLATLGQVAAGVAHEINQPVAAIRTYSENAAAFLARQAPDKAAANLGQIVGLTDRIAQITGELRSFARRKTGAVGAVRLDDAIEAALLIVHHRIAASQTRIEWDPGDASCLVRADRVRLEQVFVNLIQNALDATAKRRPGHISMVVRKTSGRVEVDVSDNGDGVPRAVRRKLFTPFATGREDGLGLGLAIARDILREFGGELELVATGREGSRFRATLSPP